MSNDPNLEWLGHVQPIGLVVAPRVLQERGLVPAEQTRADTEEMEALLAPEGPALGDPWRLAEVVLSWPASRVAGAPGGTALDDQLSAYVPEAETHLRPDWAVAKPGGGWQILVQRLPLGTDPDKRGALAGWEATPHQRLERLLRETGIPTGLLLTDDMWRLVHAPRGETSGWLSFPLRPMATVAGRPMLGALKMLLGRASLFTGAETHRLPAVLAESRAAQAAVSTELAGQVLGALHELLRGLHVADRARVTALAQSCPEHVYEGLLTVLLRLIFLLYAEDRDLIPSRADATFRAFYERGYGVRGLHVRLQEDAARNPDTMDERYGAWGRLLALFRLVHAGDGTGWIRGRGGDLFDPARFPFLQGQDGPADKPAVPRLSDGAVLRVLDLLLVLNGERLSYRTLDVEQIGSVYEAVMGFSVLPASGPALAIRAGKNNRTPVFVDLDAMVAARGRERIKTLKEEFARSQLNRAQTTAIEGARDTHAMAEALRSIVDERGSPGAAIVPTGTPLLQPTDERRRTGSHYTPRSLTEPIVRHALEPAFARIGPDATPEQVLSLRVCDPAMGSGAFLVEACRQLATRLIATWARHPGTRPSIPSDEDEDLLARRLVAQRCLYGVDKNPLAVDLARLSLWLATLARDHEFTFLDHALKSGDSLVGLTLEGIGELHWDRTASRQGALFTSFVRERVRRAIAGRAEIRDAPDDVTRAVQEARHRSSEAALDDVRTIGDATLACFFGAERDRGRRDARDRLAQEADFATDRLWDQARRMAASLRTGDHPLRTFHWQVEFPEVFTGDAPGFDAVVGNPPFSGGTKLESILGEQYRTWLVDEIAEKNRGVRGAVDLSAYFFLKCYKLISRKGSIGFISTNSIGQGDTRVVGLQRLAESGACIYRAVRSMLWPGEAATHVAMVWICKTAEGMTERHLDGQAVPYISPSLSTGEGYVSDPVVLTSNLERAFEGVKIGGEGFIINASEALAIIANNSEYSEIIKRYLTGKDLNNDPRQEPQRYIINFEDKPLSKNAARDQSCAEDFPLALNIVRERVKSQRERLPKTTSWNLGLISRWWQFGLWRPALSNAIKNKDRVLTIARVTAHHCFHFVDNKDIVFSDRLAVISTDSWVDFGILQSRIHEIWSYRPGNTTQRETRNYFVTQSFKTFPFPGSDGRIADVWSAAEAYHNYRSELMAKLGEGLTKIYNRFHDPDSNISEIVGLRELHDQVDISVIRAYGWDDLVATAKAEFLSDEHEVDHLYRGRLFWSAPLRSEVLARLLALNAERAAEERRSGLSAMLPPDQLEDEEA